jgi:hypothetical protein
VVLPTVAGEALVGGATGGARGSNSLWATKEIRATKLGIYFLNLFSVGTMRASVAGIGDRMHVIFRSDGGEGRGSGFPMPEDAQRAPCFHSSHIQGFIDKAPNMPDHKVLQTTCAAHTLASSLIWRSPNKTLMGCGFIRPNLSNYYILKAKYGNLNRDTACSST